MKDFNSDADVEEWMNENGGIEGLRRALARGAFPGQNKTLSSAWLEIHDRKKSEESKKEERSLLQRSVEASEKSAEYANKSVRWAIWATLVALVAVIVAVFKNG